MDLVMGERLRKSRPALNPPINPNVMFPVVDPSSETQGRSVGSGWKTVKVFKNGRESPCDAIQRLIRILVSDYFCGQSEASIYGAAFVIFLYEGLIICKLDCTPYLSGWCRRAFFKKSFQRNWGPQNRRNPKTISLPVKPEFFQVLFQPLRFSFNCEDHVHFHII